MCYQCFYQNYYTEITFIYTYSFFSHFSWEWFMTWVRTYPVDSSDNYFLCDRDTWWIDVNSRWLERPTFNSWLYWKGCRPDDSQYIVLVSQRIHTAIAEVVSSFERYTVYINILLFSPTLLEKMRPHVCTSHTEYIYKGKVHLHLTHVNSIENKSVNNVQIQQYPYIIQHRQLVTNADKLACAHIQISI